MSKRSLFTTLIIPGLLISGLVIFLINNRQAAPAALVLTAQQVHFGTLPEWEGPVTRSLTARNEGEYPLRIQRIHTGCGYVEITGPAAIQAGTAETFRITLNPAHLPDSETAATSSIFTDSPLTPIVHITIIATAQRFATLTPDFCAFGSIPRGATHQRRVKLTINAPTETSGIRLLPSGHRALTWQMAPHSGGDTALLTIQLDPLPDMGDFAALLTLVFPNGRTLTLPVTAEIGPPVTAASKQ